MRMRIVLAAIGVLAGLYGAFSLLQRGRSNLEHSAVWLAGGVIAHDFALAPLVLILGALAARAIAPRYRAVAAAAFIVVGTTTVVAIPVLGRFGARPDNSTLLNRQYLWGWAAFVALVVLVSAVWLVVERWTERPRR